MQSALPPWRPCPGRQGKFAPEFRSFELGELRVGEIRIGVLPGAALSGVLGIVVPGNAAGGGLGVVTLPLSVLWAIAAPTKIRLDATSAIDVFPIMWHLPGVRIRTAKLVWR